MKRILSCAALALACAAALAQPRIAVTDLAYTQEVSEYFEAGTHQQRSTLNANATSMAATQQSSGTYVAGNHSYVQQRELGSFSNDIRSALLRGTTFRLVQAKAFDAGEPQPTKAEQALNQLQTGKMAKPVRQPQVHDIVARIRKGEFAGADYVLFGTLTSLQFRDSLSPIQGTSNASHIFGLDVVADFSLINTRTQEIKASFSAQGAGSDTKLLSSRGDVLPPNRGQVIRDASRSLAANVFSQFSEQIGLAEPGLSRQLRPGAEGQPLPAGAVAPPAVPARHSEPVTVLR
jgi:hypothetical protein